MRVFRTATYLAEKENADIFIVQLAALLHDVDDRKLSPHTTVNKDRAVSFMKSKKYAVLYVKLLFLLLKKFRTPVKILINRLQLKGCAFKMQID